MQANVSVTPAGMEPMEGRRVSEFVVSALGRALRRGTAPSLMLRPGALLMGREAYSYISVTLNMRHKNDKKISNSLSPECFKSKMHRNRFLNAPSSYYLVGCGRDNSPSRRIRCLELGASVEVGSNLRPPTQIPGYTPVEKTGVVIDY